MPKLLAGAGSGKRGLLHVGLKPGSDLLVLPLLTRLSLAEVRV